MGWWGMESNEVKRLTKERVCTTHGHGQQHGDWLGVGTGWGWVEVGKGRKSGNNSNSIKNKNTDFFLKIPPRVVMRIK